MKMWVPFLRILIALLLFQSYCVPDGAVFSDTYFELLESAEKAPRIPEKCKIINTSMSKIPSTYEYLNESNSSIDIVSSDNIRSNSSIFDLLLNPIYQLLDPWIILIEQIYSFFCEVIRQTLEHYNLGPVIYLPIQYSENFASLDGGAMILRISSSNIKSSTSILEDNNDRYLFTSVKPPIEIVISLKQEVSIQRIVLKSNEQYSSTINAFEVYGAFVLNNQKHDTWFKLVEANAKNVAGQQHFRTINKVVRFLKLRILSAHGMWRYFTMNQIKVYGNNIYAEAMNQKAAKEVVTLPGVDGASVSLYSDIQNMITLSRNGSRTIPQNNLMKYFFQELQKLGQLEEKQILYLNNITKKIAKLQSQLDHHTLPPKTYIPIDQAAPPGFNNKNYQTVESVPEKSSTSSEATESLYTQVNRLKHEIDELRNTLASIPQKQEQISQGTLIVVSIGASFLLTTTAFLIAFAIMTKQSKVHTGTTTQKDEQFLYPLFSRIEHQRPSRKYKKYQGKKI